MNKIQPDSIITLHYQLLLDDDTEVETSYDDEPVEFELGDGSLTDGMEQALMDKTVGDKIAVSLSPEQAYGYPDRDKIHDMPLSDFPADLQPEAGQVIAFDGPGDEEIVGTIISIKGKQVSVDFSHPLAGRTLQFNAEIIKVDNPE
ncbi:MAG: peptidylprolyl isomerase [Gammaproteobacteria bacterium]|nr:peptidylprolyl isomerase [Gammaproteobacteria bacterium]